MQQLAAKLEQLCMEHEGLSLYKAGLPGFPFNFTRDSILSGWLFENPFMLENQLIFSARMQGTKENPVDGEEPGKIHHEMKLSTHQGISIKDIQGNPRPGITTYNGCDTTALFLFGHELLYQMTGSSVLSRTQKNNIVAACEYILRHVNGDGLFEERPPAGAEKFNLGVTYWKDSALAGRADVAYPAIYAVAHTQNLRGLRAAQEALLRIHDELDDADRDIAATVDRTIVRMRDALAAIYNERRGCFYFAMDAAGKVEGVSSDSLYALAFLQPDDIPEEWAGRMARTARVLETRIGYRGLEPALDALVIDSYHSDSVWPVEQAIIHTGAQKFNLPRVAEVSSRIRKQFMLEEATGTDYEIYKKQGNTWVPKAQRHQLWTMAAKVYFARNG